VAGGPGPSDGPDELAPLVDQTARRLGATGARVWLVSRDQRSLCRLPLGAAEQPADALGLDGTLAGRAYRSTQTLASSSDGPRLWVPLLDGTERLGVLELCHHSPELLEGLRGPVTSLAGLVGELVVSKASTPTCSNGSGAACRWVWPPSCCGVRSRR